MGSTPILAKDSNSLDHPRPLLTLTEAALELHCSKAHVSNLIRRRVPGVPALPAVRLGRRVYVRRKSLARYLDDLESRYDGRGQDSTP
jgi:hypothetical protein